jgi:heparosan-N-sulfate-glucuronate 5-epimerase
LRFFFHAADWLLQQQDDKGGWPVGVTLNKDKSKYSQADELTPGWYSGMGQGHAMSVLTRAYASSKEEKYLAAAVKAIDLFELSSSQGGVVARFLDTSYVWYEEYPTRPSSFILNGFMYSLLGLYDLWATLDEQADRFEPEKERTRDQGYITFFIFVTGAHDT